LPTSTSKTGRKRADSKTPEFAPLRKIQDSKTSLDKRTSKTSLDKGTSKNPSIKSVKSATSVKSTISKQSNESQTKRKLPKDKNEPKIAPIDEYRNRGMQTLIV